MLLAHNGQDMLAQQKGSSQVNINYPAILVPCRLKQRLDEYNARDVEQRINSPIASVNSRDCRLYTRFIDDITAIKLAVAASLVDLVADLLARVEYIKRGDTIASFGEETCCCRADTLSGTCKQRDTFCLPGLTHRVLPVQ